MSVKHEFLESIEAYLDATKMGAARFGMLAVKDPNFVADLRRGRSVGLDVVDRVRQYMEGHPERENGTTDTPSPVAGHSKSAA